MLKYFRQYNKYLLVIFTCMLMVVFLVDPSTKNMFGGGPEGVVLGRINGEKITMGQQRQAAEQIYILSQITPWLTSDLGDRGGEGKGDALVWLLAQRDAKALGLSTSDDQVNQILVAMGIDDQAMAQIAKSIGVRPHRVREAIAQWAILQQYRDLVAGVTSGGPVERVQFFTQAMQREREARIKMQQIQAEPSKYDQAAQFQVYQQMSEARRLLELANGAPRVSSPLIGRFLLDQNSGVKVAALAIPYQAQMDKVAPPANLVLEELYAKYKDQLPGQSKPFGFGYRFPDRVKLEYLEIPADQLRAAVKVTQADARQFYQENKARFTKTLPPSTQPDAATQPTTQTVPFDQMREPILKHLQETRAADLGNKLIREALAILQEEVRQKNLVLEDGYLLLPVDWKPRTLEWVAQEIQRRSKDLGAAESILPKVVRKDSTWLDRSTLDNLDQIGHSQVLTANAREASRNPGSFGDYVLSTHELKPKEDHPLIAMRLQVGLPSVPMAGTDGSRFIFRILDAQASRSPQSLDEVRDQVAYNARQLASYQALQKAAPQLLAQLHQQGIEKMAADASLKAQKFTTDLFPRRSAGANGLEAPFITEVGNSEAFVDTAFDLADQLVSAGELAKLPLDKRSASVAVDDRLTLYLMVLEQYQPIPRSQFVQRAAESATPLVVGDSLFRHDKNPLNYDILKTRVGFVPEKAEEAP